MAERRFTPPWDIEDNGSCFIIRDNNGQALSYVYYAISVGIGRTLMDPTRHPTNIRIDPKIIQLSVWQSLPPATAGEQRMPIGLHNYADQNVPRGRSS